MPIAAVKVALCVSAVIALAGCDPFVSGLTLTNACAEAQVVAVEPGLDPRRSAEELGWAAVTLEPDAIMRTGSLDAGDDFYVVLAAGTPQERLEVVTANPGEFDAFYTIAGEDCVPWGTSTLAPEHSISAEPRDP